MECEKYKDSLWDYAEGRAVDRNILEHIQKCEKCRTEIEKIKKTLGVLDILKDDFPEPVRMKENVFARIENREKLKKNIKKASFILSPVFVTAVLIFAFIFLYKRERIQIIYPEQTQILTPEEVYFAFKVPEKSIFIAIIDTQDITPDLKFVENIAFYDAKNFEADPGFHNLVIKLLNKDGEVVKEIKRTFYLTDYKVAELSSGW